jgi:replication factor A1
LKPPTGKLISATRTKHEHAANVPKRTETLSKKAQQNSTLCYTTSNTTKQTKTENRGKTNSPIEAMEDPKILKIKDLKDGMKRIEIEAKVTEKQAPREVMSRYKDVLHRVANATITDDTGSIKLTLWNEQIDQVNVNDNIKIENGYVTSFRGEIQLNVGRYGKLSINP